jgi:hypothetical protein
MSAWWNFHSASWGGASIETIYEPKDLICDPYQYQGLLADDNIISNNYPILKESYRVTRIKPYYRGAHLYHGISFYYSYTRTDDFSTQDYSHTQRYNLEVSYVSTWGDGDPSDQIRPYECSPGYVTYSYYGTPKSITGHGASETTKNVSNVTISGIPFVRSEYKSWTGTIQDWSGAQGCPIRGPWPPIPETTTTPTLNLYTY